MRQNNNWNSYNAPVVLESWTFVSHYSAFLKPTPLRHKHSLLMREEEGRKQRRGKKNFLSYADGKHKGKIHKGKERVKKPPRQSCLASCWTTMVDWLCKFLGSFLRSASLFVCMKAFLLWSWLPRLAYLLCRVNLISRHTSPTTAVTVDYEIFIATRLVTTQKLFPCIRHSNSSWGKG